MKKDLSIIIVDYKTPKLVKDLVSSIKKNTLKTSYEVIVIDNSVKNVGFSGGVNKGIKKAKGKYVLLLNSDTKVSKGAIDRLFEFAKNNPDAGAVVPQLLNKDGSVQPSVFRLPKFSLSFKKYVPKKSQVDGAVMAAFLITPKALQKVGMLDEKYFMYYEDLDYCKRLKQAGLKIYYDKDVKITHYHGESGKDKASSEDQWRRLIPSSILYHGKFKHYLLYYLTLLNQKFGLFSLLVPLFILPVVWSLLRPGFFPMQDDLQAFRVQQMDKCFDDFQIPCRWVPDAGYKFGYPQFNFYPPLPYYMGALMHRVGIQYIDVVKILFVLGYLLSAYTIYLLVSEFLGKWAGFVTAIAYTYIPYKAVEVYVRGALSEFWAQIFFPLIFWAIYKLIKTGKKSFLLVLSISAACLATTHVLMTMIFAPIAIVWAIYWLYEARWKNLGKIMWSGVLGFGLCAFFILPVMIERKFTHTEGLLSGYFDYRQHFVNLYKLFLSSEWGYGSSGFPNEKLNLSLGIVQWTTGVLALALAYINRNKNKKLFILTSGVFLVTLISVFMIHQKSSFIWAKLPLLWYMQFPWRFLAVCIFLLCLLVGFAVYLAGKYKYILGSLIIVVSIFLNLGFFCTQGLVKYHR